MTVVFVFGANKGTMSLLSNFLKWIICLCLWTLSHCGVTMLYCFYYMLIIKSWDLSVFGRHRINICLAIEIYLIFMMFLVLGHLFLCVWREKKRSLIEAFRVPVSEDSKGRPHVGEVRGWTQKFPPWLGATGQSVCARGEGLVEVPLGYCWFK